MANRSNADVLTLVAQAKGFDATGKSIDKVSAELLAMLGPLGKITKLDIESMLSKTGRRAGDAVGTLKVLAEIMDKNNNKFVITAQRVGDVGNQYELLATKVKKSVEIVTEAERKAAKEAEKAQRQREKAVDRAIAASERDEKRAAKLAADAANRAARQPDVADINKQLGGFKGGLTNAGVLAIDRANKNLLDLLSKSNITTPRLNQIFSAILKNDRSVLDSLTEGEQKVSIALRRLSAAFDQAGSAGQRTQNVLIGFRGMLRLLEVQQLHSIISSLTSYFEQASAKSIELTGHIAAIQTISQSAQRSTLDWRDALVSLSNAYGLGVIDIAKAGYEAISNQVAKGASITPFLAQAFEFARATASSAAESVDVLSSALNGYGLSTESTQKVAAILFKTIDLGRVKASELANTLGNSTPIASALGISFEELMAGISTLTVQGIRTDTALTLMNNIMLKLMKPTKGMQELFDQWGVSSGEAAVKTFGFIGILERLSQVAQKGGIAAIAADLNDMRAIRAIEGFLSNDSLKNYKDNLSNITEGQKEYKNAVVLTAEALQNKLAVEFEKLNNLFIGGIGFKKNEMFLTAIQQVGGLDKAVDGFAEALLSTTHILIQMGIPFVNLNTLLEQSNIGFSKLAPTLLTAGTAYLVLYRAGNMLTGLLPVINRSINNVTSVSHPAAVALGTLGERFGIIQKNAFNGTLQFTSFASKLANIAAVAIPAVIGALTFLSAIEEERQRKMLTARSDFIASIAQANVQANKALQESTTKLNESLTNSLTTNLKKYNLYFSVFQSRLNAFATEATKSISKFEIQHFEESLIGKTAIQRLKMISERYAELANDTEALFNAQNYEAAEKHVEKLVELTKQYKDEQRKVTEEVKKTTDKLREASEDKAFEYKYFTKSDNRKMKAFGQRSGGFQADAEAALAAKDFEKADKLIERAIAAREKSMSLSESIVSSQGFGKPKGLAQYQDLLDTRIKIQEAMGQAAIASGRGDKMSEWSEKMHGFIEKNLAGATALNNKLQEVQNSIEQINATIDKATSKRFTEKQNLLENITNFAGGLEDVVNRTTPGNAVGSFDVGSLLGQRRYTQEEFKLVLETTSIYGKLFQAKNELQKALMADSGATEDEKLKRFQAAKDILDAYIKSQEKLRNIIKGNNESRYFDLPVPTEFTTGKGINQRSAAQILEQIQKLGNDAVVSNDNVKLQEALIQKLRGDSEVANAELVKATKEIGDLFKDKLPETFKAATEAIKAAEDPIKAIQERLKETLKNLREEVEKMTPKLKDLAPSPPTGNALGGFLGGSYGGAFAGGGFIDGPLGRDNLMIRAHAGEFVVNAEAAQRFYPQLTAMNSMYTAAPNYNNGGPITQVGDININASLTGKTDIDVVTLGRALQRELKRGTIRFN